MNDKTHPDVLVEKLAGDYSIEELYEIESLIGNQLGRKRSRKKPKVKKKKIEIDTAKRDKARSILEKKYPSGTVWFALSDDFANISDIYIDNVKDLTPIIQEFTNPYSPGVQPTGWFDFSACQHPAPCRGWCRNSRSLPVVVRGTVVGHEVLDPEDDSSRYVKMVIAGVTTPCWIDPELILTEEEFLKRISEGLQPIETLQNMLKSLCDKLDERKKALNLV